MANSAVITPLGWQKATRPFFALSPAEGEFIDRCAGWTKQSRNPVTTCDKYFAKRCRFSQFWKISITDRKALIHEASRAFSPVMKIAAHTGLSRLAAGFPAWASLRSRSGLVPRRGTGDRTKVLISESLPGRKALAAHTGFEPVYRP